MKATSLFLVSMMPMIASAADTPNRPGVLKDQDPLQVQEELRPPVQKFTQETIESRVRDNLFKKEEKEEKKEAKKQ